MKNMLEILKSAKQKKIFLNNNEFKELLTRIQIADPDLNLDWDDGAGEEWARFSNLSDGIVCMINAKLGLIFIREKYHFQKIEQIIEDLEIVFTEDYCSDVWSIDVKKLSEEVPEIYWHASEGAVNANSFSLDDLYFATI